MNRAADGQVLVSTVLRESSGALVLTWWWGRSGVDALVVTLWWWCAALRCDVRHWPAAWHSGRAAAPDVCRAVLPPPPYDVPNAEMCAVTFPVGWAWRSSRKWWRSVARKRTLWVELGGLPADAGNLTFIRLPESWARRPSLKLAKSGSLGLRFVKMS